MVEHRIHCVALPDTVRRGRLDVGIVSDLDLIGAAAAGSVEGRTARDIAASEALAVSDDDVLDRAVQLMSEHQVVAPRRRRRRHAAARSASSPPSTWRACWPGTRTAES